MQQLQRQRKKLSKTRESVVTAWTLASYDMIAFHCLILFVEQNSRLNEDEGYGAHQSSQY
jgi:hypothetical protein